MLNIARWFDNRRHPYIQLLGMPITCQPSQTGACAILHYNDVIMSAMASQITGTGVSMVNPTVCSGADQRKHQSSVSLAFVRGTHRWPVNSPNKGPVTRKMFPFDDVIMLHPNSIASAIYWGRACMTKNVSNSMSIAQPADKTFVYSG